VVLALFGLVAVCGLFISQAMGSALVYRLTELLDIFDIIKYGGYGADRVFMWQAAIAQWLESPFFGRGLILEAYFTYPHNAVLEAFMTTGVIGGSAFLIFLIGCLVKAYQLLKHAPEYGWVAVLFVHYAIYVQFSSSITINSYFWYSAAGVLGLVHSLKDSGQWGRPMLRRR
jgi:O-antigen ligase